MSRGSRDEVSMTTGIRRRSGWRLMAARTASPSMRGIFTSSSISEGSAAGFTAPGPSAPRYASTSSPSRTTSISIAGAMVRKPKRVNSASSGLSSASSIFLNLTMLGIPLRPRLRGRGSEKRSIRSAPPRPPPCGLPSLPRGGRRVLRRLARDLDHAAGHAPGNQRLRFDAFGILDDPVVDGAIIPGDLGGAALEQLPGLAVAAGREALLRERELEEMRRQLRLLDLPVRGQRIEHDQHDRARDQALDRRGDRGA